MVFRVLYEGFILNYLEMSSFIKERLKMFLKDDVASAVVFGSFAKFIPRTDSDVDLLIIVKKKGKDDKAIINRLRMDFALKFGHSLSITMIAVEDFLTGIEACDPLLVGVFSGWDPIISKKWIEEKFQRLSEIIKEGEIVFVERGISWTARTLTR